jgi:polar amino acid transport system substrate-binding protein
MIYGLPRIIPLFSERATTFSMFYAAKVSSTLLLITLFSALLPSTAAAQNRTLIMGTSNAPPYMIRETNSGLDIDIPRAALERVGYTIHVRYMSLARATMEVRSKRIDLMAPLFSGDLDGIYSSKPHVMYWPTAFSLGENNVQLGSIRELANYSIMTFQGATGYFGSDFIEASKKSAQYMEIHNMMNLARLLYAGRTDTVVLDYHIFHYLKKQLSTKLQNKALTTHNIFPQVPAIVAFHDKALRDQFNKGLEEIKADGTYEKILQRYGE